MTPIEEQVSELLHGAVPATEPIAYEPVARLAHRRRVRTRLAAAGTAAVVAAGAGIAVGLGGGGSSAAPDVITTEPTPTPTQVGNVVRQGGLTYTLPAGWKRQTTQYCGQQPDLTVTGSYTPAMTCLDPAPPSQQPWRSVALTPLWTAREVQDWTGDPVTRQGQPALVTTDRDGQVVTMTLTFPLLNAAVTVSAPTEAEARALLDPVAVDDAHPVAVATAATSVEIVHVRKASSQGPPFVQLPTFITDGKTVARLLDELRSSQPSGDAVSNCSVDVGRGQLVLTVTSATGQKTSYYANANDCMLTSGTGSSVRPDPALISDLGALDPQPGDGLADVALCHPGRLAASYGGQVSPETGERSAVINVRNTSTGACGLDGYPTLAFEDSNSRLPIVAQNGGGYIPDVASPFTLAPGESARFVLATYACGNDARSITRVLLGTPDQMPLAVALPDRGSGGPQFCPGDNGGVVQIGPYLKGGTDTGPIPTAVGTSQPPSPR